MRLLRKRLPPPINIEALEKSIRRFPWLCKQLGVSYDKELVKEYLPKIVLEYQLILKKES